MTTKSTSNNTNKNNKELFVAHIVGLNIDRRFLARNESSNTFVVLRGFYGFGTLNMIMILLTRTSMKIAAGFPNACLCEEQSVSEQWPCWRMPSPQQCDGAPQGSVQKSSARVPSRTFGRKTKVIYLIKTWFWSCNSWIWWPTCRIFRENFLAVPLLVDFPKLPIGTLPLFLQCTHKKWACDHDRGFLFDSIDLFWSSQCTSKAVAPKLIQSSNRARWEEEAQGQRWKKANQDACSMKL